MSLPLGAYPSPRVLGNDFIRNWCKLEIGNYRSNRDWLALKVRYKVFFEVRSDLNCLEEVLSQFDKMRQNWIDQRDWLECQLALAEGFTNAVKHAHKDKPIDTPIEIEIDLNQEEITISIWDCGSPFDLKSIKITQQEEEEWKESGRGIEILKKIADDLSYDRLPDSRNRLKIRKRLSTVQSSP